MKILVAVKLSLDVNQLKFDREGRPLIDASPKVMGEADKCAVEEAIRIKERLGGEVHAVTIGSSSEHYRIIRDAYAMGVDRGFVVKYNEPELLDTYTVSQVIASLARRNGYDLILLGSGASDTHSAVMGPIVAGLLDYPLLANIDRLEVKSDGVIRGVSVLEDGTYTWESRMPAVATITSEANTPRIPTIRDLLRSKKKPIEELTLEDLGVKVGRLDLKEVKRYVVPRKRVKIDATEDVEKAVEELIRYLENEGVI